MHQIWWPTEPMVSIEVDMALNERVHYYQYWPNCITLPPHSSSLQCGIVGVSRSDAHTNHIYNSILYFDNVCNSSVNKLTKYQMKTILCSYS